MSKIYLRSYQWLLRALVELLDLFPPRRIERDEFALRKGILPEDYEAPAEGTFWIHGASLGEVITLRPFLREMAQQYGKDRIVCTATTLDGLRQLKVDAICGFATLLPIELPAFVIPFIERIKPKLMLISETEIWPLLLDTLARKNIPYGIINGRINEKTVRLMRIAWPMFEPAISNLAFVFPQEKQYQRRFRVLGVNAARQNTLGCFKYDIAEALPDTAKIRAKVGIAPDRPVLLFGSTHPGEEELILEALAPFWNELNATVVIAPRHVKRVEELERLFKKRRLAYQKVTENPTQADKILLVDTMGELRNFYAIAALAFVGGSLIKRGGHNLMEPAAFARPIITGPNTSNFRYEMMALNRARAVITVNNSHELSETIREWLHNHDAFAEYGVRARQVLDSMSGACHRTVKSLQNMKLLPPCQTPK
jgi:3-deoxy-D-manno-octulosonic-acid transferase